MTNLRDEDDEELLAAARQLGKQHRVLITSLREEVLDGLRHSPVHTYDEALSYCGTIYFLNARAALHDRLSAQGIVIKPEAVDMPAEARPETKFQVHSRFLVLTPDGGETKVQIERRLFAVVNGNEEAMTIPAPAQERRTMAAGEHEDVVNLIIPKEAPLGTIYRVEFSISSGSKNATATSVSGSIKVL